MTWAMSSGAGAGKRGAGLGVDAGVVDIDDRQVAPVPAGRASPVVVTAAIGAASVEHELDPGRRAAPGRSAGRPPRS